MYLWLNAKHDFFFSGWTCYATIASDDDLTSDIIAFSNEISEVGHIQLQRPSPPVCELVKYKLLEHIKKSFNIYFSHQFLICKWNFYSSLTD